MRSLSPSPVMSARNIAVRPVGEDHRRPGVLVGGMDDPGRHSEAVAVQPVTPGERLVTSYQDVAAPVAVEVDHA